MALGQGTLLGRGKNVWCPPYVAGQRLVLDKFPNEILAAIFNHVGSCQNISLVNKFFRALCIPIFFRSVEMEYESAMLHIKLEALTPAVLPTVRSFSLTSFDTQNYFGLADGCDKTLPAVLFRVLAGMPNLVEFSLQLPLRSDETGIIPALEEYVLEHRVELPTVKSLKLNTDLPVDFFLAFVFPNTVSLDMPVVDSNEITGNLRDLESLEALSLNRPWADGGWFDCDVQRLLARAPRIKYLILNGELDDIKASSLADTFAWFPKLEYLSLPDHQILHPDSPSPDPWLSTEDDPYWPVDSDKIKEMKETHPLNEDNAVNARLFFERCGPRLKHMVFCSYTGQRQAFKACYDEEKEETVFEASDPWIPWENVPAPGFWDGTLPKI